MEPLKLGAPPKYIDPEEMRARIDEYFARQDEIGKPYTVSGLALYLGFADRTSLSHYQKKDAFFEIIKSAMLRLSAQIEENMIDGKAPAGSIFWLKNHGWVDEQSVKGKFVHDFRSESDEDLERIARGEM